MKAKLGAALLCSLSVVACTRNDDAAQYLEERNVWVRDLGYSADETLEYATTSASTEGRYGLFRKGNELIVARRTYYNVRGYSSVMTPSPWRVELSRTANFSVDLTPECGAKQLSSTNCGNETQRVCLEEAWSYTIPSDESGQLWYRVRSGWLLADTTKDGSFEMVRKNVKDLEKGDELPIVMKGSIQWP